jgi:Arc/MetJ family transcription regulator
VRTTIDINDDLIQEAMRLAGAKSKKEVIHLSLRELIRHKRIERLIKKLGNVPLDLTPEDLEKLREDE